MKDLVNTLTWWILGVAWIAGVVLAPYGGGKLGAVIFPFYAWYLVVERAMKALGWL